MAPNKPTHGFVPLAGDFGDLGTGQTGQAQRDDGKLIGRERGDGFLEPHPTIQGKHALIQRKVPIGKLDLAEWGMTPLTGLVDQGVVGDGEEP